MAQCAPAVRMSSQSYPGSTSCTNGMSESLDKLCTQRERMMAGAAGIGEDDPNLIVAVRWKLTRTHIQYLHIQENVAGLAKTHIMQPM